MLVSRASGAMSRIERPSTVTSPALGRSKPAIVRKSTVLPAPDAPKIATISPRPTVSEASFKISSLPKAFATRSTVR